MVRKEHLAIQIYKIVRFYCEVVSIQSLFSKNVRIACLSLMTSSILTSPNQRQKVRLQRKNSCAKAFADRSSSKSLRPKKLGGGGYAGGGQFDPSLIPSRVKVVRNSFHFLLQLNFMKGLLVCSKRLLLLVDSRCCNNLSTY